LKTTTYIVWKNSTK